MLTRICRKKQRIAIFGFSDTLVGRVLELINLQRLYEVCLFISVNQLPVLNNDYEHSVRPHGRTEFTKNGKIFGKPHVSGASVTLHAFQPRNPRGGLRNPFRALARGLLPGDDFHIFMH